MYRVGIDIGATNIKLGFVNSDGSIFTKSSHPIDNIKSPEKLSNYIKNEIERICQDNHININLIKSIGIGIPGIINSRGLADCVNLGWKDVNIFKILKETMDIDLKIENDATVSAFAESLFGSMKDKGISVMYTLGTGIGGGIIIDGKIYSGRHNIGSEIGHIIVGENFYNCNCGNNGCLETFCSATAIVKYAIKCIQEGETSSLLKRVNGNIDLITAEMIFEEFRCGDILCSKVIKRFIKYFARGIAGIVNILDPNIISIGGGVSKSMEELIPNLKEEVGKRILYKDEKFADIVVASLGNDAGIIGAAFL